MPELLIELFSEEIPARFQRRAAADLKKAVTDQLVAAGLLYESAGAFATPRRLALHVTGVPAHSPETREARKGPRTDAPEKAIEGFLRGAGLASVSDAQIESDPKKGDFYVALIEKAGAPAVDLIAAFMPGIIEGFAWPKSMRWGSGRLNWVRPLRGIVATFGTENDEPELVPFSVDGLSSGQVTFGHRFMAPDAIRVRRFDDYAQRLERAKVVLDAERRKEIIRTDAENLAFAQGLKLIADEALLDEVSGLVEWPNVMMGSFDPLFLSVPEEAVIATIRVNQKCFCLRDSATGKLANRFILTSNMVPSDGGATIVAGNERVIRARLADAKFFYDHDLEVPLAEGVEKLKASVFHARLGTQYERVQRIVALAGEIAPMVGAGAEVARRAALLAKADLVTNMVGEFPELQGLMGRYYASAQGEPADIAEAIEDHYRPLGPTDRVPTKPVSIAVALADKLDLLTGFWAIDEKPTGSRDPFALRRAALGVIRIIVENGLEFPLTVEPDLLAFFHDRLKVMLRDQGARHDLVDAVITSSSDNMLDIVRRVNALSALLDTEAGKSLLAGYKRGTNILAVEEKKDGRDYSGQVDISLIAGDEEMALARAVAAAHTDVKTRVGANDYPGAVDALATLRAPVDQFFEAVLVNDPDPMVRANRLNLLARLRDIMHLVADFSKVSG